ncbi:uncharacterized protein LOC111089495 [Limulus polyphemus]|uniref:Uncharacterized protein LOC111089495 n=1 Tax=Limulus polyphemus TaxID=6850 RepID=A0ABM1TPL9_LIMPO|nr:uncharacterized protein LOC111089495 [Limulus polyphemus]
MVGVFSYSIRLVIFQCAMGMKIVNINSAETNQISDIQLQDTWKTQSTQNGIENMETLQILFSEHSYKGNVSSTPKENGLGRATEDVITSSLSTPSSTTAYSCITNKDCVIYNHAWCFSNRCLCKTGYVWSSKRDNCLETDTRNYNVIMTGVAISAVVLILLFSGCYMKRSVSSYYSSPVNQDSSSTDSPLPTVSGTTSDSFRDLAALDKPPTYDEFLSYRLRSQPHIPEDLPPPSYEESFVSVSSTASSSPLVDGSHDGLCQSL